MQLVNMFIGLFNATNARTKQAKNNIIYSLLLKGGSIVVSFLLISSTINYLNSKEFGIWLTLSSLLLWINYFDIGLGNGLRNKLAESLSKGDKLLGQIYVSTTFALMSIIMGFFFLIFSIVYPFLDLSHILNIEPNIADKLSKIVILIFGLFCLQFIFKTVGIILMADQKPALNDLIIFSGNLLSLVVIYLLAYFTDSSLNYVAITFSLCPLIIMIVAYFIVFYSKYSYLKPRLSLVKFEYTKELIGLGAQFFLIQIAVCVVVYSSTNIIITHLFGSEVVTSYNIAYKYFYAVSMAYIIIIMPFWSAATDAYTKKEFQWIKLSVKKLFFIFLGTVVITIIMIACSEIFYKLWVGNNVRISLSLSVCVALYTIFFNWSNTFIYFINGIGKIRLQLYVTIFVAIFYIPMTIFIGKLWGVNGVVLSTCISLIPTSILMPIQCVKLYSQKAKGIWLK